MNGHDNSSALNALEAMNARPPDIRGAIRDVVLDKEIKTFDKRRQILALAAAALKACGHFCRTPEGRLFYFSKFDRRLYDLEQQDFTHLLTGVSGLSPTEGEFRFVLSMIQAEAARTKPVDIHCLAYFDPARGFLAVSDGGPGVWIRERCGQWTRSWNGEQGIFFFTEPDAAPFEPDFNAAPEDLDWLLEQIPFAHGALTIEEQHNALLICLLQLFFPHFRRTAVIPAFLGPQGAGKSTALRILGRFLTGPQFDVTQLRADREDNFVAAVTNRLVCGIDNADTRVKWLEDALATYATRQRYQMRKLYTTNDEIAYRPRAFLMLSSRDPHFRRPDVAQRLLPFYFDRLDSYREEASIFDALEQRRGRVWGALLGYLGRLADVILDIPAPALRFRMADFAAFGWRATRAAGQEKAWLDILKKLDTAQSHFAAEGDGVIEVLRILLERDERIGPIESGALFRECTEVATNYGLLIPRTAPGFGQKLSAMKPIIESELGVSFVDDREHQSRRIIVIAPKEDSRRE
jgi:hypothetical protein